MAFDVTPAPQSGTAPMRQSIAVQAIPTLVSSVTDRRSLAERLASVATGEPALDLTRYGVEHRGIFGNAAITLQQIVQNINRRTRGTYTDWNFHALMKLNLGSLVNSLRELNPEERAAICTAKLGDNQTFPMLVAKYASEATGMLLDTINGLDADTQAAIFTAHDDAWETFPICVTKYAPKAVGRLLNMISGLDRDTWAKVFRSRDDIVIFPMPFTAKYGTGTFPMLVVQHAPEATETLLDMISGLDRSTRAKVLATQDNSKRTLPILVVQHAPEATETLLDMISGLNRDTRAEIYAAQDAAKETLPIVVAQCAPQVIERLLDIIGGLDARTRANVFTAQVRHGFKLTSSKCNCGVPFSMCVIRYAPEVTEEFLRMISDLDRDTRAAIFTAQDSAKETLPMYIAQYAPEATEELLRAINGLGAGTRAAVFTAQNAIKWTFPMRVAQHAPGAIGRLLAMINILDEDTRTEVFAAQNWEDWDLSLIMNRHTSGTIGRIWSGIKMRWLNARALVNLRRGG